MLTGYTSRIMEQVDRIVRRLRRSRNPSTGSKPQMTDPEIDYVTALADEYDCILEFGSGLSTLIWAKHFQHVVSVESRRSWHATIAAELGKKNISNAKLHLLEPDTCAFGPNGEEKWVTRNPSDYGARWEFTDYLKNASRILSNSAQPCVLFVDGQVRAELIEIAIEFGWSGPILLHDVEPSRDYLNAQILSHPALTQEYRVNRLVHLHAHEAL